MEVLSPAVYCCFASNRPRSSGGVFEPNMEVIKQRLMRKGVDPTPKILHTLRKKQIQKHMRRSKKVALRKGTIPITESQMKAIEQDTLFKNAAAEYRTFMSETDGRSEQKRALVGRPWERPSRADMIRFGSESERFVEKKLEYEQLEELRQELEVRNEAVLRCFLDGDDVEKIEDVGERSRLAELKWRESMKGMGDDEKIKLLSRRLSSTNLSIHDWKFSRLMKHSGLLFCEVCLLELIEQLGALRNWRQAISVVKWVYNQPEYKKCKSRFVHTKLLSFLGKERRPREALKIFNEMREDGQIYPDMAAYHSIAVTLGQAGFVEDIIHIIERMKQKPSKQLKNRGCRNWDPCLDPDIIIYNAVLNACVPSRQWKGVSWVLQQMTASGLRPTETTYGLAMEVMLKARKYDHVHNFFEKMLERRLAPKSLSYKVLVRTFWEEGKVDEAVATVRDMERRGVVGTPGVYYELACCLCNKGRWLDATMEVEKLKLLPHTKPLEITFTGMILSSLDGGYTNECISIFEYMKDHCNPNIGTINAMLKVYGSSDMFAKAKLLFESVNDVRLGIEALGESNILKPDIYTFSSMLEACAASCQWEFFEYVYKAMTLSGYNLDMSKYSWLLVKASKAGKWNLLEHAFDTTLEHGDVPHSSLFIEMLCQSIIQQNYERITFLLNGMAYASMQVSESHWTSILQKNKDRLSFHALQGLLTHLQGSNPVMEPPITDLLRSLEFLCGRAMHKQISLVPSSLNVSTDYSASHEEEEIGSDPSFPVEHCDVCTYSQEPAKSKSYNARLHNGGGKWDFLMDSKSETPGINSMLDQLTDSIGNPSSRMLSAADILQSWKDERSKNDNFCYDQNIV